MLLNSVLLLWLAQTPAAGSAWKEVIHETFDSPAALKGWALEGAGKAAVTQSGRLEVRNRREKVDGQFTEGSVLWYRTPSWGDIRIEFTCQAEPGSRVMVFFNARADNAERDIFAWQRRQSLYGDYAYEPRLELYTLGLLRSDQNSLNLRRLGGQIPRSWIECMPYPPNSNPQRYLGKVELHRALKAVDRDTLPSDPEETRKLTSRGDFPRLLAPHMKHWEEINASFQKTSIIARCVADTPVFADPAKQYQVAVEVVENRIRAWVDGRLILDHSDTSRSGGALRGGYFGFRNFRATTAWYDDVRVFRKSLPQD